MSTFRLTTDQHPFPDEVYVQASTKTLAQQYLAKVLSCPEEAVLLTQHPSPPPVDSFVLHAA